MFYLLLLGDPQGLTCFWDERPCWRVPPSFAGFCLFLGCRDRGRDSFHAPTLSVRGPLSPVDEGFQHFHETCSHIHPLERPGSEVSCLANCLHPASARHPLLQFRQMYPLRRSPWSTRAPLVYPRDHWLISDKVLGDLVFVRRGTRVLQGPGLASRCNFEGLQRRPCGAVDIVDSIKDTLDNTEQKIGAEIFKKALSYPIRLIAKNAGTNGNIVIEKVLLNENMMYGYNAAKNQYEDLMLAGIIDPTKVVRCCLEHAASMANTFLTSDAVVVEIKENKPLPTSPAASSMFPDRNLPRFPQIMPRTRNHFPRK
ncbi:hypothetical protein F2Q70_00030768 [Brassica cretica]|uniref:Uncharacterized protein n=1 Tax=Brassica cretica TaxID=69181 RepID=A0A8S9FBL5_BRACR|nr:hypothetical protein F2Q70_00030768 [Brassica cretica]